MFSQILAHKKIDSNAFCTRGWCYFSVTIDSKQLLNKPTDQHLKNYVKERTTTIKIYLLL